MAKMGMSMCVLGMAEELKDQGIAVNALWPKTGEMDVIFIFHVIVKVKLFSKMRMYPCRSS